MSQNWYSRRLETRLDFSVIGKFGLFLGLTSLFYLSCQAHTEAQTAIKEVHYTVAILGEIPRVAENVGMSLNVSGEAAFWQEKLDLTVQAVRWNGKELVQLGAPVGYFNSIGRAINSRGAVAGWAVSTRNPVDSRATVHATKFEGGKQFDLGTLGGRDSQAFGINDGGQVVGSASLKDGSRHAFLFKNGKMTQLSPLSNSPASVAYAVNDSGAVAGGCDLTPGVEHACLWMNGATIDLGALPDGKTSMARALNNKEEVVGYAGAGDEIHAFLWRKGKMIDLGTLGNEPSGANGINNKSQIVGSSKAGRKGLHAFIWENGKMQDLNSRIPTDADLLLREAYSINDLGKIVCLASDKTGHFYAALLTPKP